jgi:hypothetical protein
VYLVLKVTHAYRSTFLWWEGGTRVPSCCKRSWGMWSVADKLLLNDNSWLKKMVEDGWPPNTGASQFCQPYCLCGDYSDLHFVSESIHGQYSDEWAWLHSSKALFISTGSRVTFRPWLTNSCASLHLMTILELFPCPHWLCFLGSNSYSITSSS